MKGISHACAIIVHEELIKLVLFLEYRSYLIDTIVKKRNILNNNIWNSYK